MIRRAISVLAAVVVTASCGNPPLLPQPRAAIWSTIGPGLMAPASECNEKFDDFVVVDAPGTSDFDKFNANYPINDTESVNGGGSAHVNCYVTPSANVFNVDAQVTLGDNPNAGAIHVIGAFNPWDSKAMPTAPPDSPNIHVTFQRGDLSGQFEQMDCTATYKVMGKPNNSMGVATRRVWATATCPRALGVGTPQNVVACQGVVTFRFENCE